MERNRVLCNHRKGVRITMNLEMFKKGKLAIHCPTLEEAKELLDILYKENLSYASKERFSEWDYCDWEEHAPNTVYLMAYPTPKRDFLSLATSYKENALNLGYEIIEFKK